MQRICRPLDRLRRCSPTARAVWPPMPASISSNTSRALSAASAAGSPWATLISASMTRESSPPEATSRSGAGGLPGLAAIRISIASAPRGPHPPDARRELDLKVGIGHGQLGQSRPHRRGQRRRGLATLDADLRPPGDRVRRARRPAPARRARAPRRRARARRAEPGSARHRRGQRRYRPRACAAGAPAPPAVPRPLPRAGRRRPARRARRGSRAARPRGRRPRSAARCSRWARPAKRGSISPARSSSWAAIASSSATPTPFSGEIASAPATAAPCRVSR